MESSSCLELALEGERLCKAGDCQGGVKYFEAAVQVGTNDLRTLSAIYSQLGNAYFYLQDYGHSLEYHKHDLNLARTIGDRAGEAKASGNLGNTFKLLNKFDEAVACCQRQFDIYKELGDEVGKARALYNLGNIYHARGKHGSRTSGQDPGQYTPDSRDALERALGYYESNLEIVRKIGDRAAEGRACGNLGNTHYLLGNFALAIKFHEERLAIAKEFGDKFAERRAYSNLGNAHIFLGEFHVAADFYNKTLVIAVGLGDRALEAQACYSLGNTYTLMRDYDRAIEYHVRHLRIARELGDRVGEARACWSLGNAQAALHRTDLALHYTTLHLEISREIGDKSGQMTAQMNLADLQTIVDRDTANIKRANSCRNSSDEQLNRARRRSMENMELVKLTPDKLSAASCDVTCQAIAQKSLDKSESCETTNLSNQGSISPDGGMDEDSFFELLTRFQGRRIDDQRCSSSVLETSFQSSRSEDKENDHLRANSLHSDEEFLDMIAGIQGSRMDDQRANIDVFPGLHNSRHIIGQFATNRHEESGPDEQFFEMLMRYQGARIEEQRSELPVIDRAAPTVPDEDFISLIQRFQSNRLEEQRSSLPPLPSPSVLAPPEGHGVRRAASYGHRKPGRHEK